MTDTPPEFVFYTLTTEAGTTWWRTTSEQIERWARKNPDQFAIYAPEHGFPTWSSKVKYFLQDQCYEGDGAWIDRAYLTTEEAWHEAYAWGTEDGTQAGPAYDYTLYED